MTKDDWIFHHRIEEDTTGTNNPPKQCLHFIIKTAQVNFQSIRNLIRIYHMSLNFHRKENGECKRQGGNIDDVKVIKKKKKICKIKLHVY